MARRSAAEKAERRTSASLSTQRRRFGKHGSTVGIGEVMKELGLTHGGFYRHFRK